MGSLGQKIRELRRQRKMTQQQLAEGIVTASMVSQIESDRALPSTKVLDQLAHRLSTEPSYFRDDLQEKSEQATAHRRAKALIERGEYQEAINLLQTLVERLSPQFRESLIYNDLAHCLEKLGNLSEASSMYEQVVRVALERDDVPTAVHAYFYAGQIQRRMGRVAHARMFWFRASELLRRHAQLAMPLAMKIELHLGRVLLSQRQFQQAIDRLTVASALAEQLSATLDAAIIHHALATAHVEIENYEHALNHTHAAMVLYQSSHHSRGVNQCLVNLGFILRHQGDYDAAITHLTECVANRELTTDLSGLANALVERARCFVAKDMLEDAVRDCYRALSLDPPKPFFYALLKTLADAHLKSGDSVQALVVVKRGLSFTETDDPTYTTFLKSVESNSFSRLGKKEESVQSAQELADYILQHLE